MSRLAEFERVYAESLAEAIRQKPDEYSYAAVEAPHVARKMMEAIETGSYNHAGLGLKLATKRLGIKHTRKAIEEYLGIVRTKKEKQ